MVDSCLDPTTKRPAALHYLESLGLNVSSCVRFIVATHWHDDHMQGISNVFHQSTGAVFSCTAAVRQADFDEVLGAWEGTRLLSGGSGIDELRKILAELKTRTSGTGFPSPRLALANKVLWKRQTEPSAVVTALSPSDAAVMASINRLKPVMPAFSKARRRLPNMEPNDSSVVLSVQVGPHQVLLGADLEVRKDRGFGWLAIVDGLDVGNESHQVFKVAHHGSPNGYHDEVWDRMLAQQPWAATTPFVSGSVRLPSVGDCQQILSRTQNAYLSAPPQPIKFRDPNRTVEKTVNEATLSAHFVPGKYGQVRLRRQIKEPASSPWRVELFGHALSMDDYVAAKT